MQTFDDVLSQLVTLLRRSEAGGFVPHPAKASRTASRRPVPAAGVPAAGVPAASVVSYRDAYRCPASSWGEGGYVPEAVAPARPSAATPTSASTVGSPARPSAEPSVRMPFRLFEDN